MINLKKSPMSVNELKTFTLTIQCRFCIQSINQLDRIDRIDRYRQITCRFFGCFWILIGHMYEISWSDAHLSHKCLSPSYDSTTVLSELMANRNIFLGRHEVVAILQLFSSEFFRIFQKTQKKIIKYKRYSKYYYHKTISNIYQ